MAGKPEGYGCKLKESEIEAAALWLYRKVGGHISYTDALDIVRSICSGKFNSVTEDA